MMERYKKVALIQGIAAVAISCGIIIGLSLPFGMLPPLGKFLLPGNGVWNVPGELDDYEEIIDAGLTDEVRVYRDEWGIPHIYGHGESDLFFALGYCQAQDRMIQMDLVRRSARGTMSELIGPSMLEFDKFNLLKMENYWAEKSVIDMQESQDPEIEQIFYLLERFVAGINKYISENGNQSPFEYQFLGAEIAPWELADTLVYAKYISEYFTWDYGDFTRYNNIEKLGTVNYTELFGSPYPYQMPVCPNYGEYDDMSLPPSQFNSPASSSASPVPLNSLGTFLTEESESKSDLILDSTHIPNLDFLTEFLAGLERFPQELDRINPGYIKGSNNWAVSGNKTASGKPLLCNDMHLGWSLPGMWHEAHLVDLESDLNLYAIFLPGVPLPVAGHTEYVGWGETIASFDMLDWYYYNGINYTHYEYKGEAVAYEMIETIIPVRGEDPVSYSIKSTVHGPVFTDLVAVPGNLSEYVIACKWVSQNISYDYLALYGYMHAKNVTEFYDATRYFECLPLNIAFGDTSGNIGIMPNAKIPIRNDTNLPSWHSGAGRMPYNGSKGEGEWIGYVPFEDRPFCINPAQGYVQSANQYIAGPDYPDVETINAGGSTGYRARRINEVLAEGTELTVDDMKNLQLDTYSIRAGNMTPYLLDALDSIALSNLQQLAYDVLDVWRYDMDGDSAAAAIFSVWNEALMYSTFYDDQEVLGHFSLPSYARLEQLTKEFSASHWFDNLTSPALETRDDIIVLAFNRTLAALGDYFGTNTIAEWEWGEIHQLAFPHLLGIPALGQGPYPGYGSPFTVNPAYTANLVDWTVVQKSSAAGASERIIIDFGDMNGSLSVIPSGESAISSSPHYSDQLELFLRGQYHVQYFSATTSEMLNRWTHIESILVFKKGGN